MVIWRVPPTPQQPDGVRYRLALILAGDTRPTILYDNHHPKGHHRHVRRQRRALPIQSTLDGSSRIFWRT